MTRRAVAVLLVLALLPGCRTACAIYEDASGFVQAIRPQLEEIAGSLPADIGAQIRGWLATYDALDPQVRELCAGAAPDRLRLAVLIARASASVVRLVATYRSHGLGVGASEVQLAEAARVQSAAVRLHVRSERYVVEHGGGR